MAALKNVNITVEQQAALEKLSTSRASALFTLIDLIADMDVDGLAFLRRIGDAEDDGTKPLKEFFNKTNAETLHFLSSLRKEEVALMQLAIRIASALILIGSAVKWSILAFAAVFGAVLAIKKGWADFF